jgi:hypothetical protein
MKVVTEIRNEKGLRDSEVIGAIIKAKELVAEKTGFRLGHIDNRGCFNGTVRRNLHLQIYVGHNIYATSIYLVDKENLAPAYFCNGAFWMTINGCKVELI